MTNPTTLLQPVDLDLTPAEALQVRVRRTGWPLYRIAARVRIHPRRIGDELNGRAPLSSTVHDRLQKFLSAQANGGRFPGVAAS